MKTTDAARTVGDSRWEPEEGEEELESTNMGNSGGSGQVEIQVQALGGNGTWNLLGF